ncbi:hypothetical protein GGR58DRAFT_517078 [Xylaria digitata]|nr:hypothetical protein GGR58DRAFT_517078 [Xylaria digitata]
MADLVFPQFSRLPSELRCEVWGNFALPQGPMLHSISHRCYADNKYMFCSFVSNGRDNDRRINLLKISATRALMQVNREARKAVLAGRDLHKVTRRKMKVFMGGLYNKNKAKPLEYEDPLLQNFFFLNPDLDMFYFRCGLHLNPALFLDKSCLQKMQRIAIDIRGPISKGGMLYAPSYSKLFGANSEPHWLFARDNLPSLKTIVLVLGVHAVRRLYIYSSGFNHAGFDEDQENETNIHKWYGEDDIMSERDSDWGEPATDDHEYAYGHPDGPHENVGLDEEKYDDDLEKLFSDRFGFHNVEPESCRCAFKPVMYLSGRQAPPVQVSIAFRRWVREMVSRAKGEASEYLKRPIDIQMVMDHSGNFFDPIEGYYRLSAEFFDVDIP